MKTAFQSILFSAVAEADTAITTAPKPVAIALMSRDALLACAKARPDVALALKGKNVKCFQLGAPPVGSKLKQLDTNMITAEMDIIGFSIPTNVIARGNKGIEVPLVKGVDRQSASNAELNAQGIENLLKALNETGRIALRAYKVSIVPAIEADPEAEEEGEDQEVDFSLPAKELPTELPLS